MRINVYSQEHDLTTPPALVSKTDENGNLHYGIRLFQDGSPRLHNDPNDDDRQAITFWLPKSHAKRLQLADQFSVMEELIENLVLEGDEKPVRFTPLQPFAVP